MTNDHGGRHGVNLNLSIRYCNFAITEFCLKELAMTDNSIYQINVFAHGGTPEKPSLTFIGSVQASEVTTEKLEMLMGIKCAGNVEFEDVILAEEDTLTNNFNEAELEIFSRLAVIFAEAMDKYPDSSCVLVDISYSRLSD